MPWVRLDEEFPDHPKVVTAGPLAGWLHVCALAYCNRMMTDGFVPMSQVRRLVDFDGIVVLTEASEGDVRDAPEVDARGLAETLVLVGMWERRQGGYVIHDYLDYQPSRAETEAQRKVKSEAGKTGGVRSGQTRRSKSEAEGKQTTKQNGSRPPSEPEAPPEPEHEANGQAKSKPVSVPVPSVDRSSSSNQVAGDARPEEEEPDVGGEACLAVATGRLRRRSADLPPIGAPELWLERTVATLRSQHADLLATMVAAGKTSAEIAAAIEPPAANGVRREQGEPVFDEVFDEVAGEWRLARVAP